ncbi:acyltransferase family protein [Rubrivivax sp. RP6-9]|uniref:acyltransferase family protein n=1 Tax=Rubrivivax sp. RP6-9 TaxID=3415750 RepID=UPI003CC548B0
MAAGRVDPQALSGAGAGSGSAGYSANINGLRGLCVALVFVFHAARSGLTPPAVGADWQRALDWGVGAMAHGVEIFFMISGYVIVLSLRRHASVRGFLVDRCLRILPLWVPMVLLIGLLWPWLGGRAQPSPGFLDWLGIVAANALLLPPLLPLPLLHPASWSLTVEALFYAVAAAIATLAQARRLPAAVRGLAASVLVAAVVLLLPVALCFAVGVAVALAPCRALPASRWHGLATPALLAFLLLWRAVDAAGLETAATLPVLLQQGGGPALVAALSVGGWALACLCAPGSQAMPLLRTRLLQRLGTISYSFYLWHLLVMFAAKRAVLRLWPDGAGQWPATLLFAAVSLALSWWLASLSWRWMEQAFGGWLRARLGLLRPRALALAP